MAKRSSKRKTPRAQWAGFDLSTTALGLGARSEAGEEAYADAPIEGATTWRKQPAFDLQAVPGLILKLLRKLTGEGWDFTGTRLSFSVRQHDMVLVDDERQVMIPALSWQCNAATRPVAALRDQGAEATVGRIEERFILPKLVYVLGADRRLRKRIAGVMTTGDWIAAMLTGKTRLSTSDALSNGLLDQKNKKLAADVIRRAGLEPDWFPAVIQSGKNIGTVSTKAVQGDSDAWREVRAALRGAKVVAGLGDNHATGVGCGLGERDFSTIVVSAGTSGTINRVAPLGSQLRGEAACFEFYRNRMLLMMLADCCSWYNWFVKSVTPKTQKKRGLDELNDLAMQAELDRARRVLHHDRRAHFPPNWGDMSLGLQVASTQYSIMLELLLLVKAMRREVIEPRQSVANFVLTGGLSQSRFFQQLFNVGCKMLAPEANVWLSARKGPLRFQTAAYGAMLNAMRPTDAKAAEKLCPLRRCPGPSAEKNRQMQYLLASGGI